MDKIWKKEEGTETGSISRKGSVTPSEKFRTFPLADRAQTEGASGQAIPSEEDVWQVKTFGDENEK